MSLLGLCCKDSGSPHYKLQPKLVLSRYQNGMTLIEIMISLLIGAFLLGGVLQVFIGTKQTNRMQENVSRLQENGRLALDFLSKDIRMAGYWGCLVPAVANIDIAGTNDNNNVNKIDNGTDTITISGAFDLTNPPAGVCGTGVDTSAAYYSTIAYKINNVTLQRNADGLVEGVENMQILYGADSDANGSPDYYVAAGTVGLDMTKVISIRITLTLQTLDAHLTTTGDGRIRRSFTTTIALRNRLP
ncbi:MAG: prepilin-type N-terminal cleavage/methylation domain-containing protein [Methylococcaceae bacterium]|nr:prepilin-type N-terminal cleavage/methylation domain-containing protein [Methylococcaceae bacterium]